MQNKQRSPLTFDQLKPDLICLGFAFYGEHSKESPDPEKTILAVCYLFSTEVKTFKMLITWLIEVSSVINVERLKALYEQEPEFSLNQSVGLYILTSRMIEAGDKSYGSLHARIQNELKPRKSQIEELLKEHSDAYLIEKYGVDLEMKKLSVQIYKLDGADHKKVLSLKQILGTNPWLRFRAIIGANYRADVLYLKSLNRFKTKYALWKFLGSSQETAYRLSKDLDQFSELKFEIEWAKRIGDSKPLSS